jgi:ribose/xylose/arabinose/galactoside ABC-type transport system permease subunit
VPPFILTLGGLSVLGSLALQRADDRPVPSPGAFMWLRTGSVLGVRWPIALALVLLAVCGFVLRFTRFGRHVYALGSSEEAAYLAGLPVQRTKVLVFAISGLMVGLAGVILMARIGAGDPRAGNGLELRAIAAVVLGGASLAGGRGTAVGTFLGVLLLGVVGTALNFLDIDASYEGLVFGGVLILAVLLTALSDRRRDRPGRSLGTLLSRPPKPPTIPTPHGGVRPDGG